MPQKWLIFILCRAKTNSKPEIAVIGYFSGKFGWCSNFGGWNGRGNLFTRLLLGIVAEIWNASWTLQLETKSTGRLFLSAQTGVYRFIFGFDIKEKIFF